jgi:6-pyruvoyltetrahydropterin/6-carboxytetrahydropterin synthase
MIIRKELFIDSAHKLNLPYESKCNNLHGHRWKIVITLEAGLNANGMILDFKAIKTFFEQYDHAYLNDLFDFEPTAERMAAFFASQLKTKYGFDKVRIELYETPSSCAIIEL